MTINEPNLPIKFRPANELKPADEPEPKSRAVMELRLVNETKPVNKPKSMAAIEPRLANDARELHLPKEHFKIVVVGSGDGDNWGAEDGSNWAFKFSRSWPDGISTKDPTGSYVDVHESLLSINGRSCYLTVDHYTHSLVASYSAAQRVWKKKIANCDAIIFIYTIYSRPSFSLLLPFAGPENQNQHPKPGYLIGCCRAKTSAPQVIKQQEGQEMAKLLRVGYREFVPDERYKDTLYDIVQVLREKVDNKPVASTSDRYSRADELLHSTHILTSTKV